MSETRICKACLHSLSLDRFRITKNGYYYRICRDCQYRNTYNPELGRIKRRSFNGRLSKMFSQIKSRLKYGNLSYRRLKCTFTWEQFKAFAMANGYPELHKKWESAGFAHNLTPSVDRIDNAGNYELSNIRLLTLEENLQRPRRYTRPRKLYEAVFYIILVPVQSELENRSEDTSAL